jgi:hypothetical protein
MIIVAGELSREIIEEALRDIDSRGDLQAATQQCLDLPETDDAATWCGSKVGHPKPVDIPRRGSDAVSQMKGYFDELIAAGYLIQGVPDA